MAIVDVSAKLEVLGQPFSSKLAYARNVWDMQVFNGRVYLGHGNSSNTNPAPNAGPIPVVYYDPATSSFITQTVITTTGAKQYLDEEQLDLFKILNGVLYTPGNDGRGDTGDMGNHYSLNPVADMWTKSRTIPKGIHVYDMAYFEGKLYAAIAASATPNPGTTPDIIMSTDNGATWTKVGSINIYGPMRAYTLFEFKGKLYGSNGIPPVTNTWSDEAKLLSISGGVATSVTVNGGSMFPGIVKSALNYIKLVRSQVVLNKLVYIAGEIYNDHQWIPLGLFVATDINNAVKVTLPNANALPMDILIRGNQVYILAYVKNTDGTYTNFVFKTNDLATWGEVLEFKHATFARSFEELNGDFYFGLGCHMDVIPESTGTILKVKFTSY